MDYQLYLKCNRFADYYKMVQPNIYFFLKDCGIKSIYSASGNRFPTPESQNICNAFQADMQKAQWHRNQITREDYLNYLEDLFKKVNFNTIDLESCEMMKAFLEYLKSFGNIDQLSMKRIDYLNQKIQKFKSNPRMSMNTTNIFSIVPNPNPVANPQPPINLKKNPTIVSLDLPDAGKSENKIKKAEELEMARLNDIMREMKLNSPLYITNVQPGQFYNPYINTNYIPNGVNRNIPLPMRKSDPNYQHLRAIIEKELILANQELDYHKIDMARNHLEIAAYYLKNVID